MQSEYERNRSAQRSHLTSAMDVISPPEFRSTTNHHNTARERKLRMEQGSIASVFSSDEGGAKESYCSVARNDFDPQKSSVLSPQYERAKPPDRLSKELKDKANFTWGEEKPEYESSTHRDWRTTRESPPPPNVYVKPFQLEEKKTKESYNIINGMERPKDVVEKQFSFGGARANNDKYKPERTTTHEYDPIQGAMKQRSKPPSPQDVSQVPPLRSAPGLRPPSN